MKKLLGGLWVLVTCAALAGCSSQPATEKKTDPKPADQPPPAGKAAPKPIS